MNIETQMQSLDMITVETTHDSISQLNGVITVSAYALPYMTVFNCDSAKPINVNTAALIRLTDTNGWFLINVSNVMEYYCNQEHHMVTRLKLKGKLIVTEKVDNITVIPTTVVSNIYRYKNILCLILSGDFDRIMESYEAFDQEIYRKYSLVSYGGEMYRMIKVSKDGSISETWAMDMIETAIPTDGVGTEYIRNKLALYLSSTTKELYSIQDYRRLRNVVLKQNAIGGSMHEAI